jgi:hypothetical protein
MSTINRKYTTISIPKKFDEFIPSLQKAYSESTGINVSRGETVGMAIKNEYEKSLQNNNTLKAHQ